MIKKGILDRYAVRWVHDLRAQCSGDAERPNQVQKLVVFSKEAAGCHDPCDARTLVNDLVEIALRLWRQLAGHRRRRSELHPTGAHLFLEPLHQGLHVPLHFGRTDRTRFGQFALRLVYILAQPLALALKLGVVIGPVPVSWIIGSHVNDLRRDHPPYDDGARPARHRRASIRFVTGRPDAA